MRVLEGELLCSPTDLTGFAACAHLTRLELAADRGELERPTRDDPLLDVLTRRGLEHEQRLLEGMRAAGAVVVAIEPDHSSRAGLEAAAAETIDAMRSGVDVVFQATFLHDRWVGHADFVWRVATPSDLGEWSYEVADAKLARSAKAAAVLQLCAYSEQVARIQGHAPERVHVLTGDGRRVTLRLADHAAYFRALRQRFVDALDDTVDTYPDPVEHCRVCRWADVCTRRRRDDDHLCLVAGIRGDQMRRLGEVGITTRGALGALAVPPTVDGIGAATLGRLHAQARLQVAGEGEARPRHELLEPVAPDDGARLGFAALPAPSPGDLFLDFEGDPFAEGSGLEYLLGVVEVVDGERRYTPLWAHDRDEEKVAFEALVDFVVERRERDPDLHVYHYAPYEPTALKRLMGLHATREAEIDDLLRGEVFVDLYRIVRHAVRLSTESYSLKEVERLYTERSGAVVDAGESIVRYERYLETGDEARLTELAAYNRDDCESLIGLRDWLEARRVEAEARFGAIERPGPPDSGVSEELTEREAERARIAARLCAGIPDNAGERSPDEQARWTLAHLLGWHRREDKPKWWAYFERVHTYDADDFVEDTECIGGLTYESEVGEVKRSVVHRYRFEPQDHKIRVHDKPHDPATESAAGTVVAVGDDSVDLKRAVASTVPHPTALVPEDTRNTDVMQEAIEEVARYVATHGIGGPGPFGVARELLARATPRVAGVEPGERLQRDGETSLEAANRIVTRLDATCLAIQGPPGTGKTFTGAHMIVTAIAAGLRVGITANSHAVITNLLDAVCAVADDLGVDVDGVQKVGDDESTGCDDDRIECTNDNAAVVAALGTGAATLAAGTAWLWAREDMGRSVDVLFVDEAGQMSLANAVAVSTAATNLVLLGDPQQLAQPSRGTHPEGVGVSALAHLLGDHETMLPERGLFLDASYRMHPGVSSFVSEIAYEERLGSAPGRERQGVDGQAGLRFVPVEHTGNRVRSPEEAEVVAALVEGFVGRPWRDHDGAERALELGDVIVIAPYNAQVAELHAHLPEGARVGTVDKFQGQEGAVAIYSMASSSVDDAPRGMRFLYDLHRLNVAISRARALGVIVASPALARVLCRTPEQMRLANALCRFVEVADLQEPAGSR